MAKIFNMEELKARMLIGTKEEMTELLEVVDNQQLSKLEKKIYKTLLLFKLEKFKESNDSMDELIKEIGDLDLPNQAKMHMFRAEILEKLYMEQEAWRQENQKEEAEAEALKKMALKPLQKALGIFRDLSQDNNPYFGEHHFYLQIGDSFERFKSYKNALKCYQYIFETKEKFFIYPNDWAIRMASYYKYFEITQLIDQKMVDKKLFENCQKEINQQKRKLVDQFRLDYYKGVNCLLGDNIDEGLDLLEKSEKEYFEKNKMKRNHKLMNYVNKFIKIKDPFKISGEEPQQKGFDLDVYAIQLVPKFIELNKNYEKIVKQRLEYLNKKKQRDKNKDLKKINEIEQEISEKEKLLTNYQLEDKTSIEAQIQYLKDNLRFFQENYFNVHKYFLRFQYRPEGSILQDISRSLDLVMEFPMSREKQSGQNIFQYCCFEFIQIECYDYAQFFLERLTDKGFIVVFILILFISSIQGTNQIIDLTKRILGYDIPYGVILSSDQFVKILLFMIDCIKEQKDVEEKIQNLNKDLIKQLQKYSSEEYSKELLAEVKDLKFYDPYIYELKDVLYTYLFKRKEENLQAIFTNGDTYVQILKNTKASWEVNRKETQDNKENKDKKEIKE